MGLIFIAKSSAPPFLIYRSIFNMSSCYCHIKSFLTLWECFEPAASLNSKGDRVRRLIETNCLSNLY